MSAVELLPKDSVGPVGNPERRWFFRIPNKGLGQLESEIGLSKRLSDAGGVIIVMSFDFLHERGQFR